MTTIRLFRQTHLLRFGGKTPNDQRRCDPDAAVWRAVLPGALTAEDIDKLVRFEVLSYGDSGSSQSVAAREGAIQGELDLLERRIASSEKAYQRQIIRRKIDELVQYYEQCRQAQDLPSIPGAVIISCDEKLTFEPVESGAAVGA